MLQKETWWCRWALNDGRLTARAITFDHCVKCLQFSCCERLVHGFQKRAVPVRSRTESGCDDSAICFERVPRGRSTIAAGLFLILSFEDELCALCSNMCSRINTFIHRHCQPLLSSQRVEPVLQNAMLRPKRPPSWTRHGNHNTYA